MALIIGRENDCRYCNHSDCFGFGTPGAGASTAGSDAGESGARTAKPTAGAPQSVQTCPTCLPHSRLV